MSQKERLDEIIRLRKKGLNNTEIGRKLGVHRSTVLRIAKRANITLPDPDVENNDTISVEQADDELTLNAKGRVQSLQALLEQANVDTKKWRVTKWVANKWEALGKHGATVPLWQVKAWLQALPEYARQQIKPIKHLPRKPSRSSEIGLKKALIVPDSQNGYKIDRGSNKHTPLHDRKAWDLAVQAAQQIQPDEIILLGDMLDLAPFGKYTTEPELHFTTTPTLIELHWWLGQLRLAAPAAKIIYLEGNHELRLRRQLTDGLKEAVNVRPVNDPNGPAALSVPRLLALDELDIEYMAPYPNAEYWLWDSIRFFHGTIARKGGGASASAVIRDANTHTVFGHIHRVELCAKTTSDAKGQNIIYAMTPGTIARIDGVVPGATRRSDWQQGLGVAYKSPTGQVSVDLVTIQNGSCILNGRMIHGEDRTDEIRDATNYRWF